MTRAPRPDYVVDRYEELLAERRTRRLIRRALFVLLWFLIAGGAVAVLSGGC